MRRKNFKICYALTLAAVCLAAPARAEWVSLSNALPEADIRWVVSDPKDSKIIYAASLRPSDRLQMHDIVAKSLDEAGDSTTLGTAIDAVSELLRGRGIATEVINLAI